MIKKVSAPRRIDGRATARIAARLMGVAAAPSAEELLAGEDPGALPWDFSLLAVYPWRIRIAAEVMRGGPDSPLISHLSAAEDVPHLAVDDGASADDSLWIVVAEDALSDGTPGWLTQLCRPTMVVRHFDVGDKILRVTATLLKTCLLNEHLD